ncbi:hypothetical protein KUTeg_006660 [Tegillarca granosa]|uniref:Protein kinase domain-containing protein n=1 Tax=Tegillarca granosa TaxID=220873 RepID=A0ABQ9FAZ2_TEGGR|nr:hypothetical protein KUTeg_006660 [Tegillarca granosa]
MTARFYVISTRNSIFSMEDNQFISIDETANSDKSLDKEEAQKNLQNFQRQVFRFDKFIGSELLPGMSQQPNNSDNFNEDELFGCGNTEGHQDQIVPSGTNHPEDSPDGMSPSASDKRNRFKSTRNDEIDETENDNENEVFDKNITYEYQGNRLDSGNSSVNAISRRSRSLPDLVLSSPEYSVNSENRLKGKYSPDVVMWKSASKENAEKLDSVEDKLADLKKVCNSEKPKFKRSVSFQDKASEKIISPTYSATQKRDGFRKSSGYGTGDSSLQSMNSNVSTMSRENSKFGTSIDQEKEFGDQDPGKMFNRNRHDSGIQNEGHGDNFSFDNEIENYSKSDCQNNRPYLSIFNSDYSGPLNPTQSVNNSSNIISQENNLPCGNNMPHFVLFDKEQEEHSVSSEKPNTELLSVDKARKFVLKHYIRNNSSASSMAELSPLSPNQSNANTPSSYINAVPVPEFMKSLLSIIQQTDDPELKQIEQEQFLQKLENMEEISSKGASILSDYSSTSSSSLCHSGDSSNTVKKVTDENSDKKVLVKEDMTVQNLELTSRCREHSCNNKTCNKVRMCIRGLETALEQSWSPDIPLIKTTCSCLWGHAKYCDEPDYTCRIPWCLHLKLHMGEMEARLNQNRGSGDSVGLDDIRSVADRTADDVFTILSRIYRTPVLTCQVIPDDNPNKVLKFTSEVSCNRDIELLTSFGHFRNVFLSVHSKNSSKQCILKRIQNCETDNDVMVIYSKLKHKNHRNIVQHFWLAEYDRVCHLCTEFLKGGTLEECLQMVTLTHTRAVMYMLQILDAVMYLHNLKIVYLYWSCSNMLFVDTSRQHLKLCNLSLSVVEDKELCDVGLTKLSLPPCIVPPEKHPPDRISLREISEQLSHGTAAAF